MKHGLVVDAAADQLGRVDGGLHLDMGVARSDRPEGEGTRDGEKTSIRRGRGEDKTSLNGA